MSRHQRRAADQPPPESPFGGFPGARAMGDAERQSVDDVIVARSPYRFYGLDSRHCCQRLEARLAAFTGRRHALAVSSGTAALHCALQATGVGAGDEVILPAYAWSADLMAILATGATPVIVPIDETLGLDVDALDAVEGCLTSRTRAVLAVHMRGYPCAVDRLAERFRDTDVVLVEDGAQCLGGQAQGRPVGAFGDLAVFSFQAHKLLTGGEGGAVVCDDDARFERIRRFHDLGMCRSEGDPDPEGSDAIGGLGLNYRMTELQAALILAQFDRLPALLEGLRRAHEVATACAAELRTREIVDTRPTLPGAVGNFATLGLRKGPAAPADTGAFLDALRGAGIPAQHAGRLDPHHFRTWQAFLERAGYPYRSVPGRSDQILERSAFADLRPLPVDAPTTPASARRSRRGG